MTRRRANTSSYAVVEDLRVIPPPLLVPATTAALCGPRAKCHGWGDSSGKDCWGAELGEVARWQV
jgi:hypothetical protein